MPLSSSPSTGRPAPAYITTPIYYVNDRPHIGHAYTTTLCDVWARAMRMDGRDVFFLTGTDEHGVKVEKSAKDRGITPQALADENSAEFRKVMGLFGLTNDDFIRTTEARHESQVKLFVEKLLKSGDIYLGDGALERLKVRVGYSDYTHTEFEGPGEVGTVFDSTSIEARAELVQNAAGVLRGATGVQFLHRDFSAVGAEAYVPPNLTDQLAVFTLLDRVNLCAD